MEEWKFIDGFENLYKISNYGNVMNTKTLRILKTYKPKDRYVNVGLRLNGKQYKRNIHRLVAEAFIENPLNKPEVNHKDANKLNNFSDNLEWSTSQENTDHAKENCLRKTKLNIVLARQIRNEFIPFIVTREILAKKYNVSIGTIVDVLGNRIWKEKDI